LAKFVEQAHDGLAIGHAFETEQTFQDGIMAGDFGVLEAIGTTPDREHELGDELLGPVAAIGAGFWHACGGKGGVQAEMIEHALHQAHAASGGDFFVAKSQIEFHHASALKTRSLTVAENTPEHDSNQPLGLMASIRLGGLMGNPG
jgi:hypothetical protein